jgi:hypothetical protein
LQNISKRLFFLVSLFLVLAVLPANIKAAYVISSLDFTVSPTAGNYGRIGSDVKFQMMVIDTLQTYASLSAVSVTATDIYVYSAALPVSGPTVANPFYVYDGTRTWRVTGYSPNPNNSSQNTLRLNAGNLQAGNLLNDYMSLEYAVFTAATGMPVTGGNASVDIAQSAVGIALFDDGNLALHNDAVLNNGIYNCIFNVTEAYKFDLSGANVKGHFNKNFIKAGNDPFTAPRNIWLDSIRPSISIPDAHPNPYNPNTGLFQLFYYLNEKSTINFNIYYNSVTIKTMVLDGTSGYNAPILWDGKSNTGTIQADGDFSYSFLLTDYAGNTTITKAAALKITTVELETTIYSIDTHYSNPAEPQIAAIIVVNYELTNATPANLQNLGFDYPEIAGVNHDYRNYPYVYLDTRLYDSAGNILAKYGTDNNPLVDNDPIYTFIDFPNYGDGLPMSGFNFTTLPGNPCGYPEAPIYSRGDDQKGNDWDSVFANPLTYQGGGKFTGTTSVFLVDDISDPGIYSFSAKSVLVGKSLGVKPDSEIVNEIVTCSDGMGGTINASYRYYQYHAYPSYFYDETVGHISDERGYGLASLQDTASFMVEADETVPSADNIAPVIITSSEYPSQNEIVQPFAITAQNPVRIMLTDAGVGAGPENLSTFILYNPYGTRVSGKVTWSGSNADGSWTIKYEPDSPITMGGLYSFMVIPVDAANNIGEAKTFSFTVADTSIPYVPNNGATVQSSTGSTLALSDSTSTQVNFVVSKISAVILSGGTSLVDWNSSTIVVKDSNGNNVQGSVSHVSGTNILSFTPSVSLADGNYTVNITAISENDYPGAYSYNFYVTTANVTYVNLTGSGETSATCMRITDLVQPSAGILDQGSTAVSPTAITVSNVTAPSLPSSNTVLGSPISFALNSPHQLPLTINQQLANVVVRLHFGTPEINTLTAIGMDETNITVWRWDGNVWTQVVNPGNAITNGTDHYFEFSVTSITANNVFALMYVTPAVPLATFKFSSTKGFNPVKESSKIYYTDSITGVENIKVAIYGLNGALVRKSEYKNSSDTALFTGNDLNPYGAEVKYYYAWDGKNDSGAYVKNGVYVIKMQIEKTSGKENISRVIAVIK